MPNPKHANQYPKLFSRLLNYIQDPEAKPLEFTLPTFRETEAIRVKWHGYARALGLTAHEHKKSGEMEQYRFYLERHNIAMGWFFRITMPEGISRPLKGEPRDVGPCKLTFASRSHDSTLTALEEQLEEQLGEGGTSSSTSTRETTAELDPDKLFNEEG